MVQNNLSSYNILNILIGLVWLANGLFCKVLNLVPRHQEIVGSILGYSQAPLLTQLIGISEVVMSIWIWSKFKSKWNSIIQMSIIALMNIIEFIAVPELLLWGRINALFALLFIGIIYANEFIFKPRKN